MQKRRQWLFKETKGSTFWRLTVDVLILSFLAVSTITGRAELVQYTYDAMQRLTRVTYGNGTAVDYVYDNLGNRLMKATTLSGGPANSPPNTVSNPSIPNGGTNVTLTPSLSWNAASDPNPGDAVVYYVYFSTSPSPPLVFSDWATNWSPARLRGLSTY